MTLNHLSKLPFFFLFFLTYLFSQPRLDPLLYQSYEASTDKIVLQEPLKDLLELTHLSFDGTAKDLIKITQETWLRPKDKERWEIDELASIDRQAFLKAFEQLDMIRAIPIPPGEKALAILGGASAPAMKKRLEILVDSWKKGYRYKKIAILTGNRPMDVRVESEEIMTTPYPLLPWKKPLTPFPRDENELASWLINHIVWPQGMQETFLQVSLEKQEDGSLRKPTFIDTLKFFRKEHEPSLRQQIGEHPKALLISSQPHAHVQLLQAQATLGDWLEIELGAYACPEGTKISVMLDALARRIYGSLED